MLRIYLFPLVGRQPALTAHQDLEPHGSEKIIFFFALYLSPPHDMFLSADIRPALGAVAGIWCCSRGPTCSIVATVMAAPVSSLPHVFVTRSCNCGSLQASGIQKEGKDVLWVSSLPAPPLWMCMQDAHGKPVGRAGGYWGVVPWGDVTGSWRAKPLLVLIEALCLEQQRSRGPLSMFKLKRLQADDGQIPTHVT